LKFITPIITALVAGALVFFFYQKKVDSNNSTFSLIELKEAQLSVEKSLAEKLNKLDQQLDAFSSSISNDRNFSLRLLVENDRSSPDVTEKAGQFLDPMGFSILEITDSAFNILSSGHFPASAGNGDTLKASLIGKSPLLLDDNIMGSNVLTFQTGKRFAIAGMTFYAIGGIQVNSEFLNGLSPRNGVKVLLKRGKVILGMENIRSISEIKDNKIIINDKEYLAVQMYLPYAGEGEKPVLITLIQK